MLTALKSLGEKCYKCLGTHMSRRREGQTKTQVIDQMPYSSISVIASTIKIILIFPFFCFSVVFFLTDYNKSV